MPRYRTPARTVASHQPHPKGQVCTLATTKEKARPKPGSMASPLMSSWNQVVGFLTDGEGLRLAVLPQVQYSEELRHVTI